MKFTYVILVCYNMFRIENGMCEIDSFVYRETQKNFDLLRFMGGNILKFILTCLSCTKHIELNIR